MATDTESFDRTHTASAPGKPARAVRSAKRGSGPEEPSGVFSFFRRGALGVLHGLASLKLAVLLFALSIFIILVGTLAQVRQDMWEVMAVYFRAWICWIEVGVFFPPTWFPALHEQPMVMRGLIAGFAMTVAGLSAIPCFARSSRHPLWLVAAWAVLTLGAATAAQAVVRGDFLFPGGATIGTLLALNLLAAHAVRFTFQASGIRLLSGALVILVGVVVTWQVIAAGHNPDGLQGVPVFEWSTLWTMCKVGLLLLWLAMVVGMTMLVRDGGRRRIEVVLLGGCTVLVAVLTGWVWLGGEAAYLGDAGMRILWQLIQAQAVALVLLFGCLLTFHKRGGMVLIHGGLALLMLGEWFVSWYAVEERLMIQEGQSANFAVDIRETELSIVDPAYSETEEDVVVIPQSAITAAFRRRETIRHPDLPFDVQVVDYMPNSELADPSPDLVNPATAGNGRRLLAVSRRGRGGASLGSVDMASAYIRLLHKDSGDPLGVYMVSQYLSAQDFPERVRVDDNTYHVALRFKRTYKPYTMYLHKLLKDDYIGTSTPRDYASYVHLMDPKRGVDRDNIRIWMNNPLRYAGETFYQSGYHRDPNTGIGTTTLQVVTNTGWMIPYVACMLVGTGMFAHFWNILLRFLQRRAREPVKPRAGTVVLEESDGRQAKRRKGKQAEVSAGGSAGWGYVLVPGLIGLLCLGWAAGKAVPRSTPSGDFDLVAFGKLPVVYEGRVKPMDTLARNALQKISDHETFRGEGGRRHSAVEWFLDVVANPRRGDHHRVFRIYNLEVLQTLGLERRQGYHYSLAEIRGDGHRARDTLEDFEKQVRQAREMDPEDLSFYQRKLLETDVRFRTYLLYATTFQPMQFPPLPTPEDIQKDREAATQRIFRLLGAVSESEKMLEQMHAPLAVPQLSANGDAAADAEDKPWLPYATAVNKGFLRHQILSEPLNPAVERLHAVFAAYAADDPVTFNREVAAYRQLLDQRTPPHLQQRKVAFESYFNHVSPFYLCIVLYLVAFVLSATAWLGWSKTLNRSAFTVLVIAFLIHTLGVIARIYISGRPPVTNLYGSAVFIGWACVLFGLVLEWLYRLGIGNVVAAVSGVGALLIAAFLGLRGDTFTVLQAVLDTQFWLTTHVVTITLGYAVTYVAGLLGLLYIILGFFTKTLTNDLGKVLVRMIYGSVCFAIFFSFVGTVLGGLWADDSWGRFWGWDPKENGALILVLWGALMLHARWDGMVRDRGFAVLAVGGNIVTSWSWFGVNELSVGLHSYGFTEGVLRVLGLFVLSQLAIIAVGCLPLSKWLSFRQANAAPRVL